jgi:hypothetical protein
MNTCPSEHGRGGLHQATSPRAILHWEQLSILFNAMKQCHKDLFEVGVRGDSNRRAWRAAGSNRARARRSCDRGAHWAEQVENLRLEERPALPTAIAVATAAEP